MIDAPDALTLSRTVKPDIELLHVVIDQSDFVVAHEELHHIRLDPPLWRTHLEEPRGTLMFLGLWLVVSWTMADARACQLVLV